MNKRAYISILINKNKKLTKENERLKETVTIMSSGLINVMLSPEQTSMGVRVDFNNEIYKLPIDVIQEILCGVLTKYFKELQKQGGLDNYLANTICPRQFRKVVDLTKKEED